MNHWVLDDGPFGLLARLAATVDEWPAGHLHVADSVAAHAAQDRTGRRQQLLAPRGSADPCVVVHSIVTGTSMAKMIYEHLRARAADASRDLGEDESIALCALELRSAVFVTMDKGAAYQALVELGPGRVSSAFDLWIELRDEGLIAAADFAKLCHATAKADTAIAGVPMRIATRIAPKDT